MVKCHWRFCRLYVNKAEQTLYRSFSIITKKNVSALLLMETALCLHVTLNVIWKITLLLLLLLMMILMMATIKLSCFVKWLNNKRQKEYFSKEYYWEISPLQAPAHTEGKTKLIYWMTLCSNESYIQIKLFSSLRNDFFLLQNICNTGQNTWQKLNKPRKKYTRAKHFAVCFYLILTTILKKPFLTGRLGTKLCPHTVWRTF